MKESGLDVRRFRFLDQESGAVDWAGIREDLQVSYHSLSHLRRQREQQLMSIGSNAKIGRFAVCERDGTYRSGDQCVAMADPDHVTGGTSPL